PPTPQLHTLSLHDALPISTNLTEDTNPANNLATAATTAQRVADLSILKTAPATATSGTNITYTLVVTNIGPSTSSGGTVTDVLRSEEHTSELQSRSDLVCR